MMKFGGRMWSALALGSALLAGTAAMAQGPGGGMGMGPGGGMGMGANGMRPCPGFGMHQPPMERAFGMMGGHGRWWNNPRVVARLKLTDQQRKTMDGILLAHREKLIDLRAGVEKAELAMEPLISADRPNEAQILSQIDRVAQARAELEKANARFLLAIRDQLTPEQWKQVQNFRADRAYGRRWMGPGGWQSNGTEPEGGNPNGQDQHPMPPQSGAKPGNAGPGAGTEP
ncbi:MAG: Spy/CpxP family protein refolding chaperone [Terracidiphilus sp.]